MARPGAQPATSNRLLAAGLAAMLLLGLTPVRYAGWVAYVGEPVVRLVAPVSGPVGQLARWATRPGAADLGQRDIEQLIIDRDLAQQRYLRERELNAALRRQIADLNAALALNPRLAARQVTAPVIARASDPSSTVLTVRAGSALGVDTGDVVTVRGVQLVGRVERVTGSTCYVRPITDASAGPAGGLRALVMLDDETGLQALLKPTREGTLAGDVEDVRASDGEPIGEPQEGQIVRLRDQDYWPAHAQMLVIGRVERVESAPEQPLRRRVVVRPTADLGRVSEVTIRTSEARVGEDTGADEDETGGGG